jgi:hypothetical protein
LSMKRQRLARCKTLLIFSKLRLLQLLRPLKSNNADGTQSPSQPQHCHRNRINGAQESRIG